jgi:uroporphyrinogen-III synthase/chlorite dismutase
MSKATTQPQPLAGRRVLVTRTREQASVLSERLRALGAIPLEFPTIRIVPPTDWGALDAALKRLYVSDETGYAWFVLTSANGVHICLQRLRELGYDLRAMSGVRIATIGPATAAALTDYGVTADLVPDEYIAEGVTRALLKDARQHQVSLVGQRILLARAAEARKVLFTDLQQAGALVDEVPAYYTVPVARDDEHGREILHLLQDGQLDILTFTSSSTVRNFVAWVESSGRHVLEQIPQHTQLASIGPITSQTARELGLRIDIEAKEFTIDGLVSAIILHEEKIMIEQTITTNGVQPETRPTAEQPKPKQPRQLVRFTFYKLDQQWQLLPADQREQGKQQIKQIFDDYAKDELIRSFALYGVRSDCDFMLWQATYDIDNLRLLNSQIRCSAMGPYLRETQSMLSMTKRSVYVGKNARGSHDPRLVITPDDKKYLFVYPFVKTRPWYMLSMEERKRMMNEHIRVGLKYPSVSLNTTYSFGLDDQEFVVAFETDNISDFLDLVQELRETEASQYTLRDTPMYTCVAQPIDGILDSIGA